MDLSRSTTVFIILCTILITTTAAPIVEEDIDESNGEFGEYVEGDMLLTEDQKDALYNTDINTRNGLRDTTKRWPNRTVVYYFVKSDFGGNEQKIIEGAMAEIKKKSCLTFRPRNNDNEHAVRIQATHGGCYANLGRSPPNSQQMLNLGKGCVHHAIAIHEMLHTLGFFHMQSAYDRDNYVTIVWENIQNGFESNFVKYSNGFVTDFGVSYDYGSVMHYPANAFSRNGKDTIVTKQKNVSIGQRKGLSEKDILKLNRMYC